MAHASYHVLMKSWSSISLTAISTDHLWWGAYMKHSAVQPNLTIKAQLPETKKLAGIQTKEVQGEGFGQLRFDDTTGQISTQLQSTHGATQLNLGNLSHPKETAESEGRGEGFELRTDQWGAVRAGQGLLVSTHPQQQAAAMHLDAQAAKEQIEANLNSSQSLK